MESSGISPILIKLSSPLITQGIRADLFLTQKIKRLSRSQAQEIIRKGDLLVNSLPTKASKKIYGNETIELWRVPPPEPPCDFSAIEIIYEHEDFLVINKPPNLAIHPSARYYHNTLTAWLKQQDPHSPPRPCHRLDRETSGLLICAKSKAADSYIKGLFMRGCIQKTYIAIVRGKISTPFEVSTPLALQGDAGLVRIRMIAQPDGMPAKTTFEPLCFDEEKNRSLITCFPKTGRQHQIRAHLSISGYPIVGDKLYAMGDEFFDAYTLGISDDDLLEHHRQALHAYELSFVYKDKTFTFQCPLPKDFNDLGRWTSFKPIWSLPPEGNFG